MNAELREIASSLLPGISLDQARVSQEGSFHEVILVPGEAVVRVAREEVSARELARRTDLLSRLAAADLPFEVPVPLSPVTIVGGRTAVAVSWIGGAPHPAGAGDPARLREVLDALAGVDLRAIKDVLDVPHAYAGGARWEALMLDEVVPRLPSHLRAEAKGRVEDALALEPVEASLVHGDLAGHNMLWAEDGRLIGVLDWDFAQPYDPAIDVACLAWHGWDAVRAAVGAETFARARTWYRTFGIEQIAAALVHGWDVESAAERAAAWLEHPRSSGPPLPGRSFR